ncbi:hypothetical protein J6590_040068 [Homalodisca vitripennis]|nr:hypothetical protein J6590_040068 [Homalodisca vitripennis]
MKLFGRLNPYFQPSVSLKFQENITWKLLKLIVDKLPHRHDLPVNQTINEKVVFLNACIEELVMRRKIQALHFNKVSSKYFTRHGLHLNMKGKRLRTHPRSAGCLSSLYFVWWIDRTVDPSLFSRLFIVALHCLVDLQDRGPIPAQQVVYRRLTLSGGSKGPWTIPAQPLVYRRSTLSGGSRNPRTHPRSAGSLSSLYFVWWIEKTFIVALLCLVDREDRGPIPAQPVVYRRSTLSVYRRSTLSGGSRRPWTHPRSAGSLSSLYFVWWIEKTFIVALLCLVDREDRGPIPAKPVVCRCYTLSNGSRRLRTHPRSAGCLSSLYFIWWFEKTEDPSPLSRLLIITLFCLVDRQDRGPIPAQPIVYRRSSLSGRSRGQWTHPY